MTGLLAVREELVTLRQGAGGRAMRRLIEECLAAGFSAAPGAAIGLAEMDDGAAFPLGDQWLVLTRYEYRLLSALLARPGAILSREHLMDDVWRDAPETVDRTVDTHVKTLRAKLRAARPGSDPIQTHRGLGYSVQA